MNFGEAVGYGVLTFAMLLVFFYCIDEIYDRFMKLLHKKKDKVR